MTLVPPFSRTSCLWVTSLSEPGLILQFGSVPFLPRLLVPGAFAEHRAATLAAAAGGAPSEQGPGVVWFDAPIAAGVPCNLHSLWLQHGSGGGVHSQCQDPSETKIDGGSAGGRYPQHGSSVVSRLPLGALVCLAAARRGFHSRPGGATQKLANILQNLRLLHGWPTRIMNAV